MDIIANREEVLDTLSDLDPDAEPVFGKMTPQHMVEHLAFTVRFSNGNTSFPLSLDPQMAQKIREYVILTDNMIQPGFKSPVIDDQPPPLEHGTMSDAVAALRQELYDFDHFYKDERQKKVMNPVMGELNYDEWVIFHNKHFAHHFRQFSLAR